MPSYQNRKSHCWDKTILRPSYLHNGISYTGKTTSLYWIRAQICIPVYKDEIRLYIWHIKKLENNKKIYTHYNDVIMGAIASHITSLTIVYSTVYSGADQRKHESSASLAFVRRIHRGSVNSPHKWPCTRKMFPFNDVIMNYIEAKITYDTWQLHSAIAHLRVTTL